MVYFVSKLVKRIIFSRLRSHLNTFPSLSPFQSAYRKFHSTETALLRIQNDLLLGIENKQVSALFFLDLSAAFDTIDHEILLTRLQTHFGISGSANNLLSSYLQNRSQSVKINSHISRPIAVPTGIPQCSVLGPLLFSLYTTPLSELLSASGLSSHLYADDTQLYISFPPSESSISLTLLSSTLDAVHAWFTSNRLLLNPSKTEHLLIGTPQQRSPVATWVSSLTLTCHLISSVCQSSFYQLRQLRQIRPCLDLNSATIIANSLVSTKLDYCNSLYYGLPESSITPLQRVQNSLARIVHPSVKRRHHISPVLKKLHWLPIRQRINHKIATITYKTLYNHQPSYLHNLITHITTSGHRSSDKTLLETHRITSSNGHRSFLYAAPTILNSLPLSLRQSPSILSFRSGLQTHLFPP